MKILIVQNKKGIGDLVIYLPYIEAIAKKFATKIYLLAKENSKATELMKNNKNIKEIIILDRDNKNNNGVHDGLTGTFSLVKKIKSYKFDKVFIFNSSLRFNLIAKLSKIPIIFQYPLFKKTNQHIINTAKNFIKTNLDLQVDEDPKIQISLKSISEAIEKYKIDENNLNVLLGIGGSGPTKRIPAETFLKVMEKIVDQKKCHFFLATGKDKDEQIILNQILESKFKKLCTSLDSLSIKDTLPIIKKCTFAICNDTGFGHLSAALNIKTIMLMADAPLMYGNYSSKMFPIIPDGEKTVSHSTRGKDKINPSKIYQKIQEILD